MLKIWLPTISAFAGAQRLRLLSVTGFPVCPRPQLADL
jgi:hypothetical protein